MADRRYETLVLVNPELGEPGAKDLAARIRTLIEDQKGTVSQVLEWGTRELAYPIHKQRRAIYVLFEYRASVDGLREIERNVKLMDPVLRFISVRQDEDAPPAAFRPARGAEPEEPEMDEGGLEAEGAGDGEGA
ncbi:MAG TPA: 30S ribosomal protein S6 [Candidatus Eisenbacteria bacterium]|nr:30S ribosomal protein S6 [Candidatus Eisenbacteria bacterium]